MLNVSVPAVGGTRTSQVGLSDVKLGAGLVTHENLERRFTATAVWFEALAPTGDAERGFGTGNWVLSPGAGIALNPTDLFPVYMSASYLHEVEKTPNSERAPLRSLQLEFQTVHILPKGFFIGALPTIVIDRTHLAVGLNGTPVQPDGATSSGRRSRLAE